MKNFSEILISSNVLSDLCASANMKPLLAMSIISILSIGVIIPSYAQCVYGCESSPVPITTQQNQVKLTDKGSLMVGFYTDPVKPTISDKTSLEISFEDKDSRVSLSNVDYQFLIAKDNVSVYQTSVTHSTQGQAKVQYQFKDPGQYQVTVYVTGMSSHQMPQESAAFGLTIGPSAVPEFPTSATIMLLIALVSIILISSRTKLYA